MSPPLLRRCGAQWAYHDLMHLSQLYAMVQSRLKQGMGNTRLFYNLTLDV